MRHRSSRREWLDHEHDYSDACDCADHEEAAAGAARAGAAGAHGRPVTGSVPEAEPRSGPGPRSVPELAARYGISMEEVRHFTERLREEDDDLRRELRVRQIARRVAAGTYGVDPDRLAEAMERCLAGDHPGDL